jgi:EAL domain-containing protein (putative c-di-GMP-specific phosphodiesterase class I)/GGDEF domain-containing protein
LTRGRKLKPSGSGGWLPTDGLWTLTAVGLIATAAAAAGAGAAAPILLLPVVVLGVAVLAVGMRRQAAAERLAARLCGEGAGAAPLSETLSRLAARLDLMDRREPRIHPITDLPTRAVLIEEITADIAAGREARMIGVVRFVDFDRLAAFDQDAANAALSQLSRRLATATRPTHILAQIDRDCFGVWFRDVGPPVASAEFRSIVYVAGQDIVDGDSTLTPMIEAGAASFPDDGADGAQLLLRATAALGGHAAPRAGEPKLASPPPIEGAREQFILEQGLARAIGEGQLAMVFQPVVDLSLGRMTGAEALLRWEHPTLGSVSPTRFIPVVETMGLSESYGLWVLNAACREARRWRDDGLVGLKVAVNLSARQLLDPGLRPKIERTLGRHGLDPSALELELTETAAMVDADRTVKLFVELRAMGISLAIDDFGTGYSSLSYLKNLPFDKLKIDREFVTDIQNRGDNRAICRALIELGRGLGLLVLAEGAETAAEVEALCALGCSLFQGFHFSRPISSEAFLSLARDPTWLTSLGLSRHRYQTQHKARLSA